MNDTLYEQLVVRKANGKDAAIKALSIAVIVLLALSSFLLGFVMMFVAFIWGMIVVFFIIPKQNVEYEYSLLNHELGIDIIYNQSKRKHLLALDLKETEIIAPRNSHRLDSYHDFTMQDCSSREASSPTYAIMSTISQKKTCILISPDEELLARIASALPRTFYRD